MGERTALLERRRQWQYTELKQRRRIWREWIQQRYVLVLMGMLGMINSFTMRTCLSVAISEMTSPPNATAAASSNGEETCPYENEPGTNSSSGALDRHYDFDWSQEAQGLMLGAFYIGYIVTHVPGGLIADRYGGKHTLGLGLLVTAVGTFITPWAAQVADVGGVVAVRILMGLGEGVTFPAIYVLLARWAPEQERSFMGSVILAGPQLGTLLGNVLSGFLLEAYGWINTFYVYGALGVVWFAFWIFLCYSSPSDHPFISDKEAKYLKENVTGAQDQEKETEAARTPWRAMLTSLPIWMLIIAETGHDWGFYTMVTDLPKYMSDVQHYNISSNGVLSAAPFLCMWIATMIMSGAGDLVISKKWLSTTNVRKLFTTIGSVGSGAFLLAAGYGGCDGTLVVVLFCAGMACMGACYPGLRVNALDLSPNHAGTIGALMNGIGALAGVGAPYAIALIAPNGLVSEWLVVFWINFVISAVTNVGFLIWGSGDLQWWDDPKAESAESRKDCEKPGAASAPSAVLQSTAM